MKGFTASFNDVTEKASQNLAVAVASTFTKHRKVLAKVAAGVAGVSALAVSSGAVALTAPAAGSFAYDMYDIGVNQILNGAPGFIGGVCGIIYSATLINKNWIAAALGILACTAVLRADAITTSLGMII